MTRWKDFSKKEKQNIIFLKKSVYLLKIFYLKRKIMSLITST
jgi:hypothetical protein